MKSHNSSRLFTILAPVVASSALFFAAVPTAAADDERLCIRAGRGTLYAVGEGYARADCRAGDSPYVVPAAARGMEFCVLDAIPGITSVRVCACGEGEIAEMAGPYSVSPPGLVYDLRTTPAWEDYRAVIAQVTAQQSGSITLALRCATQ